MFCPCCHARARMPGIILCFLCSLTLDLPCALLLPSSFLPDSPLHLYNPLSFAAFLWYLQKSCALGATTKRKPCSLPFPFISLPRFLTAFHESKDISAASTGFGATYWSGFRGRGFCTGLGSSGYSSRSGISNLANSTKRWLEQPQPEHPPPSARRSGPSGAYT